MQIRRSAALLLVLAVFVSALWAQAPQPGGGIINTTAGTGARGLGGEGVPGTQSPLNFITGDPNIEDDFGHVAVDRSGNLYIADKNNHRIRRVDTNGVITTFAGTNQGFSGDRKSTRLNSSHIQKSRMPSSA